MASPSSHALKSRNKPTARRQSASEPADSVGSATKCRTTRTTEKTRGAASARGTIGIPTTGGTTEAQALRARIERPRASSAPICRATGHPRPRNYAPAYTESSPQGSHPVQRWTRGSSRLRRSVSTAHAKRTCANIGRDRQRVVQPLPFVPCEFSVIPRGRQVGVWIYRRPALNGGSPWQQH